MIWKAFEKLFKREESISQEKMIVRISRILAGEDEPPLGELLEMCEEFFGECVLSIILSEERTVLASTENTEKLREVQGVAIRIKDAKRKEHYLKSEQNGLYFRKGVGCICIYPLNAITNIPCFLMVEQKYLKLPSFDRMVDILSIAVRLNLLLGGCLDNQTDKQTGLGNRDNLVGFLSQYDYVKENYLGMFCITNMEQLNLKLGMSGVDSIIEGIAGILNRSFKGHAYRVAGAKFCVWQQDGLYQVVSRLQDCFDEIMDSYPMVRIGCVATPGMKDIYKTMYLCEKVCEEREEDAVIVIRDAEQEFAGGETREESFYSSCGQDVEEGDYEDVEYREVSLEEERVKEARKSFKNKETKSESEEDYSFSFADYGDREEEEE